MYNRALNNFVLKNQILYFLSKTETDEFFLWIVSPVLFIHNSTVNLLSFPKYVLFIILYYLNFHKFYSVFYNSF